ncbi:hypothetical protein GWI33_000091 [Rhynchophorus ferrugineus]|uniref:Uncharacterized protein n=1 Tax=Rhynchophorus ferrugineus TaxID=354439 RepID=A0A834IYU2_RHYFE|nr:hypothetical protein GWI33_000091 [Rhynchophorus ferrugineus]
MPKKPRKYHKHKDVSNHKHHSSHHKHSLKPRKHHHKRTTENALDTIHEVSKERIPIDSKACGDHNTSADIGKKDLEVRHQSLEQHGSNLLNKTKNFFRREKSLNNCPNKSKPVNDTITIQLKEKEKTRKKSHSHKKIVSNVQEVIFCQMHQKPYATKVDKNASEVRDIYRRLRKDRKIHQTDNVIDKNKPSVKNESYHSHQISQTDEIHRKHHKRHVADHVEKLDATSNKKDHVRDERRSNGPCEKYKIARKHPSGRHKASAEENSTRKHRTDQLPSADKPQDPSTLKEDEIRKIVEGNMTNYFAKFQSIIDKKLDCLTQCHKKGDDRKSNKKEKLVTKEEGLKYRDEIVKEVLKKIKREEKEIRRKKDTTKEPKQKVHEETQAAPVKQPKPPRSPHTASTAANDFYLNEYLFKKHYISPMDCRSFSEYKLLPAMDSITSHKKRLRSNVEKSPENPDLSSLMRHMKESHKKSHLRRPFNELVTLNDGQLSLQPHSIYKETTKLISLPKLDDVKKSQRNSEEILIQGIEPPSSDSPKPQKSKAKKFECKTMSIVRIWPKKERTKSPLPQQKQSNELDVDLVERKKTSKRFRLYYKYSLRHQIKHDPIISSSDGKSTISDSCKDVLDPSDESVEIHPIKNNNRLKPVKLHQCYFRPITSSHSEYCFDIRKHQTRSTPTSHKKNSLHRSKSTLPLEKNIKSLPPKASKRCQTSTCYVETKTDFNEIYKTLDDLEDNLQKCGLRCPEMKSVSVNATPPIIESIEDIKIANTPKSKDVLTRVDAGVGSGDLKEYEKKKTNTREVAVEVSMEPRVPSNSKNKKLRSIGVSPIRIIGEKEDKPNKSVAEQNQTIRKVNTPKMSKNPQTNSTPFRKTVLQPVHNKPFSFQHVISPQVVLVQDKSDITPKEIKPSKPSSRLSKRTHSSSKDRPKSKPIEVKPKPEKPAVSPHRERDDSSNKTVKTACDLHVMDKNHDSNEGSTSSSVSDALDRIARKSQSLTHIKSKKESENRPKSTVCCLKPAPVAINHSSRGGSFISNNLEKFLNRPPIKTNADHCVESKLTGRLLLTKSYKGGEVSAYQKRKLYDQSIRKRMKRKFKLSKMNVGPQVFEVRFLSMMEPGSVQGDSPVQKQVFSFNFDRLKKAGIKSDKTKGKEIDGDSDANTESSKCPDATVDQKFLKWCQKLFNMTDNGDLQQPDNAQCSCSEYSENCTACKEFVGFLDVLYKSMVSYRNSVGSMKTHQTGDLEEVFPGQFGCSRSFSCQSFDISDTVDKAIRLSQPASCPMLMSNPSSFEFLYEEAPLVHLDLDPKETVLRQFDHTFHFSMSHYNVETPSPPGKKCYTSPSATESGYSSVRSKDNSTSSFFKKANILALLKPRKHSQIHVENQIEDKFKEMPETCQTYAENVIKNRDSKGQLQNLTYEEVPSETMLKQNLSITEQNPSTTMKEESDLLPNGCKIIISNDVLKLNTAFYLMGNVLRDVNIRDCSSFQSKSDTDGFSSRTEGDLSVDRIDSTTVTMVKSFVTALLESYDRETELCRQMLNNEEFLQGVLIPAAEQRIESNRRNKKGKLRGFFSRTRSESFDRNILEAEMPTDHIRAMKKLREFARHAKKDFIMLAQAVRINENIDNDIKICGMLRLLERIENGEFHLEQINLDFDFEAEVVANIIENFAGICTVTSSETKKIKKNIRCPIDNNLINLLVTKYRISLLVKTSAIPVYISRKLIQTEQQLKAAVSYLVRTTEAETNIVDFENSIETARRPSFEEGVAPPNP